MKKFLKYLGADYGQANICVRKKFYIIEIAVSNYKLSSLKVILKVFSAVGYYRFVIRTEKEFCIARK